MTVRISTALRNHVAQGGSYVQAMQNGKLVLFSGSQPATADAAETGSQLLVITASSGAHTAEVLATGTVTLTGGSSGSVNSLTVGGVPIIDAVVPYNASLNQTATDLAAAINQSMSHPNYTATASGAVVTISASLGAGATANSLVVAVTTTTLTTSTTNMASGVTPLNGLKFGVAAGGVVGKLASQVWSGVVGISGTAGWYRYYGSRADPGGVDADAAYIREDGACGTSGAQYNMSSTTLTGAATHTVDSWIRTFPAS